MTSAARRAQVLAALPDDGSYVAFGTVAERVGGETDVYGVLRDLEAAGEAVLTHGRGWRRAGAEPAGDADDYLDRTDEIVGRCGHSVQAVFASEDDAGVGFAYTVGLLARHGFELVLTGSLRPELQQALLNSAAALDPFPAARGVGQPRIMQPPYLAVLLDTTAERCRAAGYPLSVARAHRLRHGYDDGDFPVVQVVWPDSGYRYPWSQHFDYGGHDAQPLLADPPVVP